MSEFVTRPIELLAELKMETIEIDLYSVWGKDGYIRLMHTEFGPRTDLTRLFKYLRRENPHL